VAVSDSSGVRFIVLPALEEMELPSRRAVRVFSTRQLGLELDRVNDALFAPDSMLLLINGGASEVVLISADGTSVRAIGRRGDGPGEFRGYPTHLLQADDSGFFAFDSRLSRFSYDGEFIDLETYDPMSLTASVVPLRVLPDRRLLATLDEQRFGQATEQGDTMPLFIQDRERRDTLGLWLGRERAFADVPMGRLLVPVGYARTTVVGTNGRLVVVGQTDSLDVAVFDVNLDLILRIVGPSGSRAVSSEDVAAWRRLQEATMPFEHDAVARAWAAGPMHTTFPGFEGLAIDAQDRIWIGEYLPIEEENRRWIVLAPDGTPSFQITLPALRREPLPGRTELLRVGEGRLAVLRTTRLDEQYVEVWSY